MARLGRSYTSAVVTRAPAGSAQVDPQSGTSTVGVSAAGTAKKVAVVAGTCSAGIAAAGAETSTVTALPGRQPLVVTPAAAAAALRYRTQAPSVWIDLGSPQLLTASQDTGTAAVGATASGVAVKVAVVAGVCSAGMAAAGTARKVAPVAGTAAVGVAASGAETSSTTPAPVVQPVVVTRAAQLAALRSRAPATPARVMAAPPAPPTVTAESGAAAVGASAYGTAKKVVPVAGSASFGVAGYGTVGSIASRAVTGSCTAGATARGAGVKRAVAAGSTPVGLASAATARKRSALSAASTAGLACHAAAGKRTAAAGSAAAGMVCWGTVGVGAQAAGPRTRLLGRARRFAERGMLDACTIRRPTGSGTTDPVTGYPTQVYATVYTGRCRVQQHQASADRQDVGEDRLLLLRLEVQLPVLSSVGLEAGDEIRMTASAGDPDLVGRVFVIHDLAHKSEATSRRVQCTERTGS